jgi:8-oxo-dGTP diphosphatase
MKQHYCLGFLFNRDRSSVVLVEKSKHRGLEWQRGKLNGPGGKVEPGETPEEAMRREFREEASLDVNNWRRFAGLYGPDYVVHCFTAETREEVKVLRGEDDQEINFYLVRNLDQLAILPNLLWLVPLALDERTECAEVSQSRAF